MAGFEGILWDGKKYLPRRDFSYIIFEVMVIVDWLFVDSHIVSIGLCEHVHNQD